MEDLGTHGPVIELDLNTVSVFFEKRVLFQTQDKVFEEKRGFEEEYHRSLLFFYPSIIYSII